MGTERQPVNNLADALTIAVNENINSFFLRSDLTIEAGQNISGYIFETDTRR